MKCSLLYPKSQIQYLKYNMPAIYNNRTTKQSVSSLNQSQKVKPFCKVCYDTGKPESVYNSHFVRETRDLNSPVVCPTLLALSCRFCGANGHTVSKCKKALMAPTKNPAESTKKNIMVIKSVQKNLANVFDCLDNDSDDELDVSDDVSETTASITTDSSTVFPMLGGGRCAPCVTPNAGSYVNALLSGAPKKNTDHMFDSVSTASSELTIFQKLKFSKSWADSDSDEE